MLLFKNWRRVAPTPPSSNTSTQRNILRLEYYQMEMKAIRPCGIYSQQLQNNFK